MVKLNSLEDRGIYTDLLRKFSKEGHEVFAVCPVERREKLKTFIKNDKFGSVLNVQTLNLQKTNLIEKGLGTLAIEFQFLAAIKTFFSGIKFDLIVYSTPPITFSNVISYIKKRDGAYSYLLLKDIFPQNAVDMKMLKNGGFLHRFFLKKEHKLYALSDAIGCMSEANKAYILKHNPDINPKKIEVNPNSIEPFELTQTHQDKLAIKQKYGLPLDKKIFIYGGNLGKPQGLDFLLKTIETITTSNVFFLVVGSGTEYISIKKWFEVSKPHNALLLSGLPKKEYDLLLSGCDVGMIFLHKDFTIPNFPSRLLSYLEMKMPVIAATDSNTDIGNEIEKNNCGYGVLSGDIFEMQRCINEIASNEDLYNQMAENAWNYLQREFRVDNSYQLIKNRLDYV